MNNKSWRSLYLAGMMLLINFQPYAVLANTVNLQITATITAPSCVLNNGGDIDIDFGDISLADVDNDVSNKQDISFDLDCPTGAKLKLKIRGTGASFDSYVLKTDMSGLGIAFTADGSDLNLNSYYDFEHGSEPELKAVLVRDKNAIPAGGDFSATATLEVAYQ